MATIVSHPIAGHDPDSEVKVFSALQKLPNDWVVVHSVAWQGRRGNRSGDGEADFILIHPERGAIVIEVKGGNIDLVRGRWTSTDRYGRVHDIKNPFEQATASKVGLHKWLKERLGFEVPTCHAVSFPNKVSIANLGPAAPPAIVVSARDLADILATITRIFDHWKLSARFSKTQVKAITNALAPTVNVTRTLSDESYDAEVRLIELTDTQIAAFDMVRRNRRVVVFGSAGTGKTVLACEKARQMRDEGNVVLLTCYNRLLSERLGSDPTLEGVTVSTFHAHCLSLVQVAALDVPSCPDRTWWENDAPLVMMEGAGRVGSVFDVIIVDEGQDFSGQWIEALESTCKHGADSPFFIFADENQKLWQRDWDQPEGFMRFDLTKNCRNAQPIAQRVAAIVDMPLDDRGVAGPLAKWTNLSAASDAPSQVAKTVERLLGQGFDAKQIVALCETASLRDRLLEMSVGNTGFCAYGQNGVVAETIARFKGLEALAIVLALDGPTPVGPDKNAYVGFSRAMTYLHVIAERRRQDAVNWS